ncbi:MAG TPA: hypothetical protein PKE54_16200, partial [Candidatus Obscuribacter sp.]|nr:hypothetical protein [Candidatus Obscuribacter sp.]
MDRVAALVGVFRQSYTLIDSKTVLVILFALLSAGGSGDLALLYSGDFVTSTVKGDCHPAQWPVGRS